MCGVKPHVLRYWEQEFRQLRPMKRRGNRRYYQHHEVLVIRRIRQLLYDQGFTIAGARVKLDEGVQGESGRFFDDVLILKDAVRENIGAFTNRDSVASNPGERIMSEFNDAPGSEISHPGLQRVRRELLEIRDLLQVA